MHRFQKKWTAEDVELMKSLYPVKGRRAMMFLLGRTEGQIRAKASQMGLTVDQSSPHFKEWQRRAAKSKVGKRRPEQSTVMKRLHSEGKLVKSERTKQRIGAAVRKAIRRNGHPRGALGMKHSPETLAVISKASSQRWAAMTEKQKDERQEKSLRTRIENGTTAPPRPHASWKAGWREIGGIRAYCRSRWEANYARWLQFLKERGDIAMWEHEPETFWFEGIKRGCVSYLPDFRVTEKDGSVAYHEVKGWMDDRSITKIKRMAKYHPKVKLVVVDSKAYRALEKTAKLIVKGWETTKSTN